MGNLTAEQVMTKAKTQLLLKAPFYGDLLLRTKLVEDNSVPTMATNGTHIYYNKEFVENMEFEEVLFVLTHEIFHIILLHPVRVGLRDKRIWNIAGDYVINYMLTQTVDLGYRIRRPKEGLFATGIDLAKLSTEAVYDMIFEQYQQQKQQRAADKGQGNAEQGTSEASANGEQEQEQEQEQGQGGGTGRISIEPFELTLGDSTTTIHDIEIDIKYPSQREGDSTHDIESQIKKNLADALVSSKMAGKGSAGIDKLLEEVLGKKIPWYTYIKRYLTGIMGDELSFSSPDRSQLYRRKILPGMEEDDTELSEIVVAIDTSGSISEKDLGLFMFHLKGICSQFETTGRILYWDTEVCGDYVLDGARSLGKAKPYGGGGTDIQCVYDYIAQKKINYTCMIVLTDGYFHIPSKKMRDIIWVVYGNNDFNPSYGKVIKL